MQNENQTPLTERKVVRRGLIAGLAGLGAAALMKVAGAERASAADGNNWIIGSILNTTTLTTALAMNEADVPTLMVGNGAFLQINASDGIQGYTNRSVGYSAGLRGRNETAGVAAGIVGDTEDGFGVGVVGRSGKIHISEAIPRGAIGVEGQALASIGIGVRGANSGSGTGVYGVSNSSGLAATGDGAGIGVHGKTGIGSGVLGEATASSGTAAFGVRGTAAGNGTGVRGVSNSSSNLDALGNGSGIGVEGRSGSGVGVRGESVNGAGIFGKSTNAHGIEGESTNSVGMRGRSTNFVGLVGQSTSSHGLYGFTNGASAYGIVAENLGGGPGLLVTGNAQIYGSLQVFGAKNAIVKMQDGTSASVYCQESPEPYFEDFGKAQLAGGVAHVALEREFATLIVGGEYLIFLTPEGDTRGLYVSRKSATGFEVREVQGGTASVPFNYRIVTKRKDIEGKRFARVSEEPAKQVAAARAALGTSGGPAAPNQPAQQTPPVVQPPPPSPPPAAPQNHQPSAPQPPSQPGPIAGR